jgi:TRAP-type C4-dicarboxylate transport system substrate-binding protein
MPLTEWVKRLEKVGLKESDWKAENLPGDFSKEWAQYFGEMVSMCVEKPVNKPEDLRGVMIRSPGGQANDYLIALGATPVSMTVAETYEAISKGVIEATSSPLEVLKAFKIAAITKYVTILLLTP